MIHYHSHKYLYQLTSTCEQTPIDNKQYIYERKSHETKMADFILQGVRTQALHLSGKNIPLNTLGQKQYLAGEVGENCLI